MAGPRSGALEKQRWLQSSPTAFDTRSASSPSRHTKIPIKEEGAMQGSIRKEEVRTPHDQARAHPTCSPQLPHAHLTCLFWNREGKILSSSLSGTLLD